MKRLLFAGIVALGFSSPAHAGWTGNLCKADQWIYNTNRYLYENVTKPILDNVDIEIQFGFNIGIAYGGIVIRRK